MALLCCEPPTSSIDWPTIISSIGAVAIGVFAIIISHLQIKRSLNAKKEEEERQEIYKKLNDFYGPFLQLRMKSKKLYEIFVQGKQQGFRTLIALLNGETFTGNDKILLEEIIKIGKECELMIQSKAGLIDDTDIRTTLIPRASTHFLVLRLAYEGALRENVNLFNDLTFPRELDQKLEERKKQLEARLRELNRHE